MGSIILPGYLVMLLVVTSVAAMPKSSDDDIKIPPVAREHPKPRHLGTRNNKHCTYVNSSEQVIKKPSFTYEDYKICIIRSPSHQKVKDGKVKGFFEFESGKKWDDYQFLQNTNAHGANCTCTDTTDVYFKGEKMVKAYLLTECTDCDVIVEEVIVMVPSQSECYICDGESEHDKRHMEPYEPVEVTCHLDTDDQNEICEDVDD